MQMNERSHGSMYHLLAAVAAAASLISISSGVIPQLQMHLLGGHMLTNSIARVILALCLVFGIWLRPRISLAGFPISTWQLSVGFLLFEVAYLSASCGTKLSDILQSYNVYYSTFLIAPAILAFRGAVPERTLIHWTTVLFLICATIGIAQHLTGQPLLYTQSDDEKFVVQSWAFFGEIRAFSLFSSGLEFGVFCAFCGALGVALARSSPSRGLSLVLLSAFACYTTLTRNCYLVFFCASTYSAIITFGRRASRGLWSPVVFIALAIATIFAGIISFRNGSGSNIQSASSLVERLMEWTYYGNIIVRGSILQQALGFGMVQRYELDLAPVPIDNMALAITLHIGIVGLLLLSALLIGMWLYLRRQALAHQQPFVVAAASLWAALPCTGIFAIVPAAFGTVFTLAVFCEWSKRKQVRPCTSCGPATAMVPSADKQAAFS